MPDSKLRIARSVDQAIVRHANERAVLTEIALKPNVSAAAIAKGLGLGPQTVGRIIADLVERGFVELGDTVASGPGKPATPIYTAQNAAFAIGCEIGLEHSELALLNIRGVVLGAHRWNHKMVEPAELLKQVVSIIELMTNIVPVPDRSRIAGIALVYPKNMASQIKLMGGSAQLVQRWDEADIAAELTAATRLKITSYDDGSAACWGELAKLDAPRPGGMCYFLLSIFITAGVITQGRLSDGGSADLGAILVPDEGGELVQLSAVAGLQALLRDSRSKSAAALGSDPATWEWNSMEPAVAAWITNAGRALAVAAANSAAYLGCQLAIIDGAVPQQIIDRLIVAVRHNIEALPAQNIRVQLGRAGVSAPARGAAALLLYQSFFSGEWEHFPSDLKD